MNESQKKLFSEARRKQTAVLSEAEKEVSQAFGNAAAQRLASDIRGKVASYLVARSLRDRYAPLYDDPVYGKELKDRIDQEVKFAIKGDDPFNGSTS